jgi:hypothetical protein
VCVCARAPISVQLQACIVILSHDWKGGQKEDPAKPHLRAAFAFRKKLERVNSCFFSCRDLVRLHCGDYVCVGGCVGTWNFGRETCLGLG